MWNIEIIKKGKHTFWTSEADHNVTVLTPSQLQRSQQNIFGTGPVNKCLAVDCISAMPSSTLTLSRASRRRLSLSFCFSSPSLLSLDSTCWSRFCFSRCSRSTSADRRCQHHPQNLFSYYRNLYTFTAVCMCLLARICVCVCVCLQEFKCVRACVRVCACICVPLSLFSISFCTCSCL